MLLLNFHVPSDPCETYVKRRNKQWEKKKSRCGLYTCLKAPDPQTAVVEQAKSREENQKKILNSNIFQQTNEVISTWKLLRGCNIRPESVRATLAWHASEQMQGTSTPNEASLPTPWTEKHLGVAAFNSVTSPVEPFHREHPTEAFHRELLYLRTY